MKLIEKKESSKTPELIWGEKYILLKASEDIDAYETVVLVTTELDSDGELEVHSATAEGWAEPQYLQLITDEPQAVAEDTYVIEFTESELEAVTAFIGSTSWVDRKAILVDSWNHSADAEHIATAAGKFYSEIKDILQGEF